MSKKITPLQEAKNCLKAMIPEVRAQFTLVICSNNSTEPTKASLMQLDRFGENERKEDFKTGFKMPPAGQELGFTKK